MLFVRIGTDIVNTRIGKMNDTIQKFRPMKMKR